MKEGLEMLREERGKLYVVGRIKQLEPETNNILSESCEI